MKWWVFGNLVRISLNVFALYSIAIQNDWWLYSLTYLLSYMVLCWEIRFYYKKRELEALKHLSDVIEETIEKWDTRRHQH